MSRYVNHPNGLVIGSNNTYFIIDRASDDEPPVVLPEGLSDMRDNFNAILTFEGYYFEQSNSLNVFIETPAEQLVWGKSILRWEKPYKDMMLPYEKTIYNIRPWFEKWLVDNIGEKHQMWDTYTRTTFSKSRAIFFRRRKDALSAVREINRHLKGIHIGLS